MVAAYFKNIGQTRTLIQLLQERSDIQKIASQEMKVKFEHYNLELEEVLIGTPSSPEGDVQIETILTQLRSRQIATEQVETYGRQEQAAVKERELREAQSRAQMQTSITESELSINVQANQGKAEYQRSIQQAAQIRALAEAEAEKIARIGIAQALATEEQVRVPMVDHSSRSRNRYSTASPKLYNNPKWMLSRVWLSAQARTVAQAISWKACLPCCSPIALVHLPMRRKENARRRSNNYGLKFARV